MGELSVQELKNYTKEVRKSNTAIKAGKADEFEESERLQEIREKLAVKKFDLPNVEALAAQGKEKYVEYCNAVNTDAQEVMQGLKFRGPGGDVKKA